MSEKRFTYGETIDYNFFDVFEEKKYLGMIQRDSTKIVDRLNEQQTTITELNDELEKSSAFIIEQRIENKKLKEENEQLLKKNDVLHKSLKEYEKLRKRLNRDKSRLIEEKMSLNAFVIEKGLAEEYMRWENE